jgi:4-amino-4-deoxy-L-arabinose transferase-like glycosyltransferase
MTRPSSAKPSLLDRLALLLSSLQEKPGRTLVAIIVLAVLARLAFVLLFGQTLILEASGYDVYATNLLAGHGYTRMADLRPDSDLPPLYSFFLAGSYSVFGRSAIPVALLQIGMDCLSWLALYHIGRRVGGVAVGLLAVAFTAFYPYLLFQNLAVNDTAIFMVLLTTGVWAVFKAQEAGEGDGVAWRWALLAGVLFGLAALTKTLVALLLPIIGLWWWARLGLRRALLPTALLGLSFVLPLLPWMIRNTQVHGAFVLLSTNDGSNLHQGNNPCVADFLANGWDAQWVNCLGTMPDGLSEVAAAAWHRDQALTYLRENPDQWLRLFVVKLWTQWSPELLPRSIPPDLPRGQQGGQMINDAVRQYETPLFQVGRIAHLLYFTPLWALGLIGVWRAARDGQRGTPLLAVLVAITVAYVIYHPSTRYRSPGDPFLFVFAAYMLTALMRRVRQSGRAKAAITGA